MSVMWMFKARYRDIRQKQKVQFLLLLYVIGNYVISKSAYLISYSLIHISFSFFFQFDLCNIC